MTLHKSIEAAREALISAAKDYHAMSETFLKQGWMSSHREAKETALHIDALLSTLPAKPMTEDEIREKICRILHGQAYCNDKVDEQWTDFEDDANELIRALRDAGVLYVEGK